MNECLICLGAATKRYYVVWNDPNVMHTGEYCLCDRQHCYDVLYQLIDNHNNAMLSGGFTIHLLDKLTANDDPFA